MGEIKLIKKSEYCKELINQMRLNLVKAEAQVIYFRNEELIIKTSELGKVRTNLAGAILNQKQAVNLLRAYEQELEACLKEEAEEEKKKN